MKRIRTDRELRHHEQHVNRPRQEIAWCLLIYKRKFTETGIQRVKRTVQNEAGPVHGESCKIAWVVVFNLSGLYQEVFHTGIWQAIAIEQIREGFRMGNFGADFWGMSWSSVVKEEERPLWEQRRWKTRQSGSWPSALGVVSCSYERSFRALERWWKKLSEAKPWRAEMLALLECLGFTDGKFPLLPSISQMP